MGLITRVLGAGGAARSVGGAVTGVAEVFVGNRATREAAEHAAFAATVGQYGAEFATVRNSRFDGFMNGLNRLPRPLLVIGTLGLFVYAMVAPGGFSVRMQGLALVPEPLWWLLGAIVSFYFGARELHYRRDGGVPAAIVAAIPTPAARDVVSAAPTPVQAAFAAPDAAAPAPEPAERHAPEAATEPRQPVLDPVAPPALDPVAPPAPQPRPFAVAAPVAVAVRAADPHFNAAIEEWTRLRA